MAGYDVMSDEWSEAWRGSEYAMSGFDGLIRVGCIYGSSAGWFGNTAGEAGVRWSISELSSYPILWCIVY